MNEVVTTRISTHLKQHCGTLAMMMNRHFKLKKERAKKDSLFSILNAEPKVPEKSSARP